MRGVARTWSFAGAKTRGWRGRVLQIAGLAVSTIAVVGLLRVVPTGAAVTRLEQARPIDLALALVAYALTFAFKVERWRLLVSHADRPSRKSFGEALAIGFGLNGVAPTRVGDVARVALLAGHDRVSVGVATLSVVVEHGIDLVALALIVVSLGLALALPTWLTRPVEVAGGLAMIIGVAFLSVANGSFRSSGVRGQVRQRLLVRVRGLAARFGDDTLVEREIGALATVASELQSPNRALTIATMTALVWLASVAFNFFTIAAFLPSPGLLAATLLAVTGLASSAIPSAPSGLGVTQFAAVLVLPIAGIPADAALAASLTGTVLSYVPITVIGLLLLGRRGVALAGTR